MQQHSRRDFLKTGATGVALTLGTGAAAHAQTTPAPTAAASGPADMAIARWKGATVADAETKAMATRLTEESIQALGGMSRFVKKGDVVWVKPNIGWNRKPEFAANTHPDVVGTLVRLCLAAGAKQVKVGDFTCNPAKETYVNSGIAAATTAAGGEMVYLDAQRFKEYPIAGKRLEKWDLYPEIVESNLVINCPVVKHHGISKMTVCMKNYMGVIGGNRGFFHQDISSCLADVTAFMKPRLCVVDAIRILTANGPSGGNLADVKRMDTVAAGIDIVALDAFGAELLGHKPADIATVAAGEAYGLGKIDYRSLKLRELEVA